MSRHSSAVCAGIVAISVATATCVITLTNRSNRCTCRDNRDTTRDTDQPLPGMA